MTRELTVVRLAVGPLRALLVVFFVGLVIAQVMSMPGQFRSMAAEDPDMAYLRWPLTIWSILLILCVQVVVACTWRLLDMVRTDRIFSDDAFRWVDVIIGSLATGWVLFVAMATYLAYLASDPGPGILVLGFSLAGAVFLLLVVVLRALLRQATTLQADMAAVI